MAEKVNDYEFQQLAPHEQIAALAYDGNAYGLADLCGVHSTHRESDLWQRLNEAGFEIVRADDQGRARG